MIPEAENSKTKAQEDFVSDKSLLCDSQMISSSCNLTFGYPDLYAHIYNVCIYQSVCPLNRTEVNIHTCPHD